nr:Tn3 family transposase [Cupriavidus necator]
MEKLVTLLDGVVDIVAEGEDDAQIGRQVRRFLAPSGNLEPLRESCAEVRAFSGNNYLPLLWRHSRAHRSVMLRLAEGLKWESTSQSCTLLAALAVVLKNEALHREWIAADVDLNFASERWRKLVRRPDNLGPPTNRRYLELCVLSHMVGELRSGDLCVVGSDAFADLYLRLDLPKHWGDGKTVAADGTQYDFYDNNLLAGYHFRYRKMGTVAYRHVADNYIAVFRHFIPPGVWEAVYVIEGLLKAGLSVEADTVHADTQGQSAAVFAFTYLLSINLMPRIRNWQDLKLYRADPSSRYRHIDRLFSGAVDWDLIALHWQDAGSAGGISPPAAHR